MNTLSLALDSFNLTAGERLLCVAAPRHALKRRMVKHKIEVLRRGDE